MPRVVPDQKAKFESDELFRRLGRKSEIRYTGYYDRTTEERQKLFQNDCRERHNIDILFVRTGTDILLSFDPYKRQEKECDFDKEHGKVHIKSHFIMNGVCVRFRGWLDLDRLDGVGYLEFDESRAMHEDSRLRQQITQLYMCLRKKAD